MRHHLKLAEVFATFIQVRVFLVPFCFQYLIQPRCLFARHGFCSIKTTPGNGIRYNPDVAPTAPLIGLTDHEAHVEKKRFWNKVNIYLLTTSLF